MFTHRASIWPTATVADGHGDLTTTAVYSMTASKMSSTERLYVAIVDDDEDFCRSLGRLLRAAGMQPITYVSAEAFLADTKRPRFDCLVLDVHLGGMSGIELGRRLIAENRETRFICLTAHYVPEARTEAELAGCAAFLRKNESGGVVLDAIRRAAR